VNRVVYHPEAAREYREAAKYYSDIEQGLGGRFFDEMEGLLRDILNMPDRYRLFDPPARRHFSDVFPYAVIYLEREDVLWVVAFMHMKRKPGYWKERLFR
jgi:toxin ParE1/3/4